jgi:3',5'-cyclic AMP phosphodiesterase CpdA
VRKAWAVIAVGAGIIAAAAYFAISRRPGAPAPIGTNPSIVASPTPSPDGLTLPKKTGSLKFAVIGDSGRGDPAQFDTAAEMARWREKFEFDFVLMLGDNIYDVSGSPESYVARFERPYKALLDKGVPFYATLGNHDPPDQWHYPLFNMNGHRYYSFTKEEGPLPVGRHKVEFFAIDTVALTDAQLAWARKAIETSEADWKIAFYHHPLYTSGRYWMNAITIRRKLEPVFTAGGVDVGLSGHEHFYERVAPQKGVQYFTSGAGGALRLNDIRRSPMTASGFDTDTHFLLMEISGDTLYFQAISRVGATVDSGSFEKINHRPPPPVIRK